MYAIEIHPWPGNATVKRKQDRRFDAEISAPAAVLLGCPFCGGAGRLEHTHTACYWIECVDCDAQVTGQWSGDASKPSHHVRAVRSAVDAWNHRV